MARLKPEDKPFSTIGFRSGFVSNDLRKAIRWARRRAVLDKQTFNNLSFENKLTSWTVSGDLTNNAILKIQKSANAAIQNGTTYRSFASSLTPKVLKSITAPRAVWDTAINQAYHKGRFDQQTKLKDLRPFLEYVTFGDDRVRPNHAAMHGVVARQGSAFWSINYPPNGFFCRCVARALSRANVRKRNLDIETLPQVNRRVRRTQLKAGVPVKKLAKPVADPGWRGSFAGGQGVAQKIGKSFGRLKRNDVSLMTRKPVKLLNFSEAA